MRTNCWTRTSLSKMQIALHAEYASQGVEFARELADTPWQTREFVVKDCDGRLLAFGSNLKAGNRG